MTTPFTLWSWNITFCSWRGGGACVLARAGVGRLLRRGAALLLGRGIQPRACGLVQGLLPQFAAHLVDPLQRRAGNVPGGDAQLQHTGHVLFRVPSGGELVPEEGLGLSVVELAHDLGPDEVLDPALDRAFAQHAARGGGQGDQVLEAPAPVGVHGAGDGRGHGEGARGGKEALRECLVDPDGRSEPDEVHAFEGALGRPGRRTGSGHYEGSIECRIHDVAFLF